MKCLLSSLYITCYIHREYFKSDCEPAQRIHKSPQRKLLRKIDKTSGKSVCFLNSITVRMFNFLFETFKL